MRIWIISAGHKNSSPRFFRSHTKEHEAVKIFFEEQDKSKWDWIDFIEHDTGTGNFSYSTPQKNQHTKWFDVVVSPFETAHMPMPTVGVIKLIRANQFVAAGRLYEDTFQRFKFDSFKCLAALRHYKKYYMGIGM